MANNFLKNKILCTSRPMAMTSFSFPPLPVLQLLLLSTLQVINSYVPDYDLAVNCGASGTTSFQNRTRVGDVDPKLFSTTIQPQTVQSSLKVDAPGPLSAEIAPFGTARILLSRFTYSFPFTTNGPKFVRLHFYPTTYANFKAYNSLFSVTSGNFTLLKDFNASLWLVNDADTVSVEYCINVEEGQTLNLTFIPSTNHHKDAYTFVNAIEVVSMPPFLYYSDPDASPDQQVHLVGFGTDRTYQVESKRALQTLYRVNVGQREIPPGEDKGMYRDWETDDRYIEMQHPLSISTGFALRLKNKTDAAPDDVYLSARSYGMNATENYNVSWRFEVDSMFYYMVRLHFCEFDAKVQHYGDRTFRIFIAENLAEEDADVIGWSGGNLIPTHRDYAVLMSSTTQEQSSKKVNISIKLQRLPNERGTTYHDVLLNGIEIFKISDDGDNLAGPNPDPERRSLQPLNQKTNLMVVIIAMVAVSGLMVASIVGVVVFRQSRKGLDMEGNKKSDVFVRRRGVFDVEGSTKSEGSSSLPTHLCRYLSIAEIRAATNNFDDVFLIGVGGFGNVYKGYIDGSIPVAIKCRKPDSHQGANEFVNEIKMLSHLRHLHLVSLIGYCNDDAEMILVYDFMQRGTLREHLYGSDNSQPLTWKQRLEILLGAARGLHYLHAGAIHNIIHRDVKSTNILLDEKWVAKVSDFGLSKVGPTGISNTHVSTMVKGSLGYLDPEYYKRQRLTLKSDVYSFGVVLLEVLCARPPLVRNVDKHKASLVDWFRRCNDQGEVDHTVDPFLKHSLKLESLKWYTQLALSCLHDDGNQRPSMSDVVGALEFGMQLVETEEDIIGVGTQC